MLWLLLACKGGEDPTDSAVVDDTQVTQPAGAFCDPSERIGQIQIYRYGDGDASVSAQVYDKASPWIGDPTLESADCAHHVYEAAFCEGCQAGQVCSLEGECVDAPRTLKDATLVVTADGVDQTLSANEQGHIYAQLGTETAFAFDLRWSGGSVVAETMTLQDGLVASVTSQGSYETPGELTVSWSGSEAGHVHTLIPINHHAGAPTFTECHAPASTGGFQVPAEMVDPLAVITGLEFQGLAHGEYAALESDGGCVQVSVMTQHYTSVQFP